MKGEPLVLERQGVTTRTFHVEHSAELLMLTNKAAAVTLFYNEGIRYAATA